MHCPFCGAKDTRVVDSRLTDEGSRIKRRRKCSVCEERFSTYEEAELALPKIIKRDNRRDPFNEDKLRIGLERAFEKRPVAATVVDTIIHHIKTRLRASGEREIPSQTVGEWIMQELRQIDAVAYVRFASVYRSFQDIEAFSREIKKLQKARQEKK